MANINYNDIQDLNVSWENYAGSSVEKFIKKELKNRAGYLYRSNAKEGDFYYLYGFTDYEQFQSWADGDSSIIPLFKVQLPNIENDVLSVNLVTNSNTNKIVNLGSGVKINLKYTSTSTNPTTGAVSDTFNDGTLIIMRSANGSAYVEVGRMLISPVSHNSTEFKEVDITRYLADGDNKIRVRVEDNVNGSTSSNITFNSIVNTTLLVQNATSTSQPLRALQLQYYIQGQVAKTLHVKVTQNGIYETFDFTIGENTYIEVPYTTPLISMNLESGTIEVEAWLTVDDTELSSLHEVNQFYYSDSSDTDTIIILNNINRNITNYANEHLFDFTLYNKGADVTVKIQSQDLQTEYLNIVYKNCNVNQVYSVYTSLEVQSSADFLTGVVTVHSDDFDCEPYNISIDNTEKMSPVAGASFVLNPKTRNNSEEHPDTIINAVSGSTVTSTFSGFGFINDGWITNDENIQVLRIPSEHTLTINYDVLNNLAHGTSFEIDFKTYSCFNDNDVIFNFSSVSGTKTLGFVMNPTEATFYTSENQTKRDQDVVFQEGVRTHLVVNIIPNLSNSGLNYIRLFVNGILNREMLYSSNDVFKSGTLTMNFGSQNCDIDIYGIRVYKTALSASDIRQNYMSNLPNIEDKVAFKNANNILSANGTISYDKVAPKYNTLIWTGAVPSYSTGDKEYKGSLTVNIIGDAAHSGTITNLRIKGQGSSSKGYWKWNHQYDFNKFEDTTVWTDGNDTQHTDGYCLTSEDPAATKLVAKLNWASSMQSHKAGATAMYTDLWKKIVGGNSITKTPGYENVRVSVHEKPFLYFVKDNVNAQPVFYGLMTFGSGKFDKPTFGYDKNVFPDYLVIEGSDNGMPLTLRQVPWFDDEVTYNVKEEYYEYAGQGNFDYGMGKKENISYFKDAINFTYLHSPFLVKFSGSIPANADKKNQYWDVSTKNVYRYDYISEDWVNAGTTKTATENEGEYEYDVLNLETQTGLLRSSYNSDDEYTAAVIAWRKSDFKSRIGVYYNTTDVLFSMAFLKLIGASDNWCKNTYEYLDPVTHKICLAQDDMDTLMLTDNVGRKTKPYYVEEHDVDGSGKPYFNGSDNVFFNLMEMTFESEEKAMMKQIFTTMATDFDDATDCIQNYFFNIQEYFPAVAYNETARLLYEEASVQQSAGIYVNGTPAISQSLGDQLEAEKQWWKRRIPYLQSWSSSNPFYTRSTTEPNLQFRSMTTTINTNPDYSFALTPWQYLYPKVGTGQYLSYDSTRVPARTVYNTVTMSTDGNTDTFIYGSNYYTSYGEFGGVSLSETFNLVGDRLLEFSADSREVSRYDFRPTRMTIACPELRSLCVYGCSTLSGSIDLSNSKKLTSVDLRNTGVTSVVLPETEKLTTVYLPAVTSLKAVNIPNVQNLNISSYSNLVNITTDKSAFALDVMTNAANLASVNLIGVDITTNESNANTVLSILTDANITCNITGEIYIDKILTSTEKDALVNKFGPGIFTEGADLYITFITQDIQSITLSSSKQVATNDDEVVITASIEGNNDATYQWSYQATNQISVSKSSRSITITTGALTSAESITVTYTITKTTGSTISQTIDIVLTPYEFYLNNKPLINANTTDFGFGFAAGSNDSSVTISGNWPIVCSNQSKSFTVNSVSGTNVTAVVSGNTITSFTCSNVSSNNQFNANIELTVDALTLSCPITIDKDLVTLTINDIANISALNGSGSGDVTFNVSSTDYPCTITMVSANVTGGNTNTVTNLTTSGCTINCSNYSTNGSRTLNVVYTVNSGANNTATKDFNVNYVEVGPKVKVIYSSSGGNDKLFTDIKELPTNLTPLQAITSMKVDNVEVEKSQYYNFGDSDVHTIDFEFVSNYGLTEAFALINNSILAVELTDVTKIGYRAFFKNFHLSTVNIYGQSLTNIGTYAFADCSSLNNIVIENTTPPSISENTFTGVKRNGTLTYPIESESAYLNTWLSDYYLGELDWNVNIVKVGDVYYGISGNEAKVYPVPSDQPKYTGNITIPSSIAYNNDNYNVTAIKKEAFRNSNITSITIANSVTTIGEKAFESCSKLQTVNLPSNIETIVSNLFANCGSLTSITIPNSVTSIGSGAFQSCSLTSITIPDSVTSIANGAFSLCSNLTSITIPDSVTSIANGAFMFNKLSSITVDSNNTVYNDGNGSNCIILTSTNTLIQGCKNTVIPNNVTAIGNYAFTVNDLTSITIPNSVTIINNNAFYSCSLTSITIPDSVTNIGEMAFSSCVHLTTVNLPSNIGAIASNVFSGCGSLTSITIPNSVTTVGSGSFSNCSSLSSITIGSGVKTLYNYCFSGCTHVSNIVINSSTAPVIYSAWGNGANTTGYSSGTTNVLYVPVDATGYDSSDWTDYLLNQNYGKFTLSKTLND